MKYKLKEGVTLPSEFKIKVNHKQSKALQLYLFSIGKEWTVNGKVIKYLESPYLFIYNGGYITQSDSTDKNLFSNHKNEQIKFKDYFEKVEEKDIIPLEITRLQKENKELKDFIMDMESKIKLLNLKK